MQLKDKITFYVPFMYAYRVRLGTSLPRFASWLFIYALPCIYYGLTGTLGMPTINEILLMFIVLVGVVSVYEWGYIDNDTLATLQEKEPTKRLSQESFDYAIQYRRLIFAVRMVIGVLVIWMVIEIMKGYLFAASMMMLLILFYVYNRWRSKENVFLYFFLVASRFVPFMLVFISVFDVWSLVFLMLVYPVEIGIERFSMPKYRYKFIKTIIPDEESKKEFRVVYYVLMSVLLSVLVIFIDKSLLSVLPFYVFLVYRVLIYKRILKL